MIHQPVLLISSRCAQTIYAQRRALATAAKSAGWRVWLAGDTSVDDPYPRRIEELGLSFIGLPVKQRSKNPLSVVALLFFYLRILRKKRPDVFHAFTIKPTIVGLIAARLARVPVRIATIAGLGHVFLSSSRLTRWVAMVMFKIALAQAHRVIFYNSDDRALFEELGLVRPDTGLLIPGSGVDTLLFQPLPLPPSSRTPTFLFIGRLLREKGVGELLKAARLLRQRGIRANIELLGDLDANNPSSLTQSELDGAISAGDVHWHGATDDVRPYIAQAHVVVLPSYREGIPLSLIEAAAMGRALVASDVPGCRDVVRDGVTGTLVPPRDAEALAHAIAQLAANPTALVAMARAARADAEERFSADIVTQRVLHEYRQLVDRHRS